MDTTKTLTHASLCFGYGGIDLGLKRAIGDVRTVLVSEIESFAVSNVVSLMEAGLMESAPVWTNLKTLPWEEFYGKVDILSGGFPCQPFSSAGRRAGDEDPRHLFPYILDGLVRLGLPGFVFLENVEGILSSKLAGEGWRDPAGTPVLLHVLRELERVGYHAEATVVSASECGAPHRRKRVFILGVRNDLADSADFRRQWRGISGQGCSPKATTGCGDRNGGMAHTDNSGSGQDLQSSELWSTGVEQSSCHRGGENTGEGQEVPFRGSDVADDDSTRGTQLVGGIKLQSCHDTSWYNGTHAWPSRPGQRQYQWEPPRVVGAIPKKLADFCSGDTRQGGNSSSSSGEGSCDRREGENSMSNGGSSICGGDQGNKSGVGNPQHHGLPSTSVTGGTQEVHHGDASWENQPMQSQGASGSGDYGGIQDVEHSAGIRIGGEHRDLEGTDGETSGVLQHASSSADSRVPNSTDNRLQEQSECSEQCGQGGEWTSDSWGVYPRESEGASSQVDGETQSQMGGDLDGSSGGVGQPSLYESNCDRASELRMLGNGVVPQSCERAFRILIDRICQD